MTVARISAGAYATGLGTLNPPMPAGWLPGHVLLLETGNHSVSDTLSVAGFTLKSDLTNSPCAQGLTRTAQIGDASPNVTWSNSGVNSGFARLIAYSGVTETLASAGVSRASTSTSSIAYAALAISVPGCLVLSGGRRFKTSTADGATMGVIAPDTSLVIVGSASIPNGANENAAVLNEWIQGAATSTSGSDGQVISVTDSNLNTMGWTIALLPRTAINPITVPRPRTRRVYSTSHYPR